jgi:uncharacterized protein
MADSVFHPGERLAQSMAGFELHGAPIRDWMPQQHRAFFESLPILFASVPDAQGWPVATVLTGPAGFIRSPDPVTLVVAAVPGADDPAAAGLLAGAPAGLLGLEFATRRRNRANGVIGSVGPEGFTVAVRQSFGNCPQYIQTRTPIVAGDEPGSAEVLSGLDGEARAAIEGADTFFVASRAGDAVDISHRGGRPGFVRAEGNVLTIPDFRGNRYFNTLGNLLLDDRAGLLFADLATGDVLQLQGRAEILWDRGAEFVGAERLWRVHVVRGWRRRAALPLRWRLDEYAPQLGRTGRWEKTGRLEKQTA